MYVCVSVVVVVALAVAVVVADDDIGSSLCVEPSTKLKLCTPFRSAFH